MTAKVGDRIVVDSIHVGQKPREGSILKVIPSPSGVEYLVRWTDGHESLFLPESGSARIVPARRRRSA